MNSDIFTQVFGAIRNAADQGTQTSGSVADFLLRAGYSAAAITEILNGVATSADASAQELALAQGEIRYLQTVPVYTEQPRANTGLFTLLLLGGVVLYATSRK